MDGRVDVRPVFSSFVPGSSQFCFECLILSSFSSKDASTFSLIISLRLLFIFSLLSLRLLLGFSLL